MATSNPTCEICGTDARIVGCCASRLGPVSFTICRTCLDHDAEPEWVFDYTAESIGQDVHDEVFAMTTFQNGRYVTYRDYLARWKPSEPVVTEIQPVTSPTFRKLFS